MMKKLVTMMLSLLMVMAVLAGCSGQNADSTTADQPEESKKALLVVSFGTSYNDSRDITIGAVENAFKEAYLDYEVRRAFTSQIVIDILEEREKMEIDNVEEAMERLVADGVTDVVIQPTHVMAGFEYDDVVKEVNEYADKFQSFVISNPLLVDDADYETLVDVLVEETKDYNVEGTAVVFMGHGTHHEANATYAKLQEVFNTAGYNNYIVGTVEAAPTLEDVVAAVKAQGAKKVVLLPLMIVAGDHATNDMAGEEEGTWKTTFEAENFEVECVLAGLGQYEGVQQMLIEHTAAAIAKWRALYPEDVLEGTYKINVDSSSSMFRIIDAQLTVKDNAMSVVLTLNGQGYEKLYVGTAKQAEKDSDEKCAYFVENEEGLYTYEIPVEALDVETDVCAWSIRKQKWYDRVLIYQSDLLPEEAIVK